MRRNYYEELEGEELDEFLRFVYTRPFIEGVEYYQTKLGESHERDIESYTDYLFNQWKGQKNGTSLEA